MKHENLQMKNLFNPTDVAEIIERIQKLTPTTQRQWGKMNVAQMLAHCNESAKNAIGITILPQAFVGKIIGKFVFKMFVLKDKPAAKNSPTDPAFIVVDEKDFDAEKSSLLGYIHDFANRGETGIANHSHPFFGQLTANEWAILGYKHLDHHLKQFGV